MFKILKYTKTKEWFFVFFSLILIIGQVYLDLTIPDYMNEITILLQTNGGVDQILINGLFMLLCALGSGVLAVAVGFISAKIGAEFAKRLRNNLYNKVSTFSTLEMNKFSVASLITRSTNDVTQVQQMVTMSIQILIKVPIMFVWAIIKIVNKNWQWSVATAVAVSLLLLSVTIISILCVPKFKKLQKQTDEINNITRENLNGLRVIKAFNAEEYVENKFDKTNKNLTKTNLFTGYTLSFINPIIQLVMNGLSLSIYVIGAFIINSATQLNNKVSLFGDMIVFFSYAMQIIAAFMMLIILFMILPRAQVSCKRINEVLATKSSIIDGIGVNPKQKGTIIFENVYFKYQDAEEPILKNINFEINQGEVVAIIGSTGSGKSTVINLIPRLYDTTSGNVLIDGENVKNYKLSELYDRIGYVSQKSVIFSGTVESNVSMGTKNNKKISQSEVEEAINNSQSQIFVQNMNGSYQAEIHRDGANISGGQKQRLSIARALARKPEILIFDDSFSALDFETDKKLRQVLSKEFNGTTCVIVAQRIGTIKNCDKIIVMDNGQIVGIGKHKQLLKNCNVYREIALSQLSKEELGYDA